MENQLLNVLNCMSEGVAIMDTNKDISYANDSFKIMMGLMTQGGPGHASGKLVSGDIVIVACNSIDSEEHMLFREDLEKIGVDVSDIDAGNGVIALGRLNGDIGTAQVEVFKDQPEGFVGNAEFTVEDDINISVVINDMSHTLTVYVNELHIDLKYQLYNALCVALDKDNHEIKFYQYRGYSLRGEDFSDLVRGKEYQAKVINGEDVNCIGKNFLDFHPEEKCIESVEKVLSGEEAFVADTYQRLNFLSYMFSVYVLYDHEDRIDGCAVVINDITTLKTLQEKVSAADKKYASFNSVVGTSVAIKESIETARKIAASKSTVLITGESGTGKGVFAKAIHNSSKRANKKFIAINMAAIPKELLESELFGYIKGAFTGANDRGKIGKFQSADGGTLFLDEIGELDLNLQAKLLDVLQEGKIYPVGSVEPIEVNVRIIAATNKNLEKEVEEKNFRSDLYYRLNVINLEMVPLRNRKEDIEPLVEYFLPRVSEKVEKRITEIDEEVLSLLYLYDWPGNVRELENVIESAANMTEDNVIDVNDLPRRFLNSIEGKLKKSKAITGIKEASAHAEKEMIEAVLKMSNNNKSQAAKTLNIARTSLYNKIKQYNIKI